MLSRFFEHLLGKDGTSSALGPSGSTHCTVEGGNPA